MTSTPLLPQGCPPQRRHDISSPWFRSSSLQLGFYLPKCEIEVLTNILKGVIYFCLVKLNIVLIVQDNSRPWSRSTTMLAIDALRSLLKNGSVCSYICYTLPYAWSFPLSPASFSLPFLYPAKSIPVTSSGSPPAPPPTTTVGHQN